MKYKYAVVAVISPLVFVLDLLTKWLVSTRMPLGDKISVIPGYLDIVHATNEGAAFGMLAASDASFRVPFFYIVAIIAVVVLFGILWRLRDDERLLPLSFALVLGGIAGNIHDRIRFGAVIDFISVHWRDAQLWGYPMYWPAFNVADSAITVAMVLLVIAAFRKPKEQF